MRALNVHGISVSVGLSTSHCSVGATPLSTHASTADEQQVPHLTGLSWSGMQVMEFRYKRNQLYTLNAAVGAAAGAASVLSLSLSPSFPERVGIHNCSRHLGRLLGGRKRERERLVYRE